jgi:hypothetical protein
VINAIKVIVLAAAAIATALPAQALADVSKCGDLRGSYDSYAAAYDALHTRMQQFERSHGMTPGGHYLDKLSIDGLISFREMARDQLRNVRKLVALTKSATDNGCINAQPWLGDAEDWIQKAPLFLKAIDVRLASLQTPPPTSAPGETVVRLVHRFPGSTHITRLH